MGVNRGVWVLTPEICRRGQSNLYFDPLKCRILSFKAVVYSARFTSTRMKDLCQKWKVNQISRCGYRLSGTAIVECLEIIDVHVGCNLKQFEG